MDEILYFPQSKFLNSHQIIIEEKKGLYVKVFYIKAKYMVPEKNIFLKHFSQLKCIITQKKSVC